VRAVSHCFGWVRGLEGVVFYLIIRPWYIIAYKNYNSESGAKQIENFTSKFESKIGKKYFCMLVSPN